MSSSPPPVLTPVLAFVVAMARNRVIGVDNDLPWHIPADLKRFKDLTMGKPVVMGRKTFQSIAARLNKPLPGRQNIVISAAGFSYPGVDVYPDIETALAETRHEFPGSDIMIIGGGSIFEQALPLVDRIYLTVIDRDVQGDASFPPLDPSEWEESAREDFEGYSFMTLDRKRSAG